MEDSAGASKAGRRSFLKGTAAVAGSAIAAAATLTNATEVAADKPKPEGKAAAGKPIGVMVHGTVGLQHASMAQSSGDVSHLAAPRALISSR